MILLSLISCLLEPFVFMFGWNKLIPSIFGGVELSYLQAFGLYTLFTLPFLNKSSFFMTTERGMRFLIDIVSENSHLSSSKSELISRADATYTKYKIGILLFGLAFFYLFF